MNGNSSSLQQKLMQKVTGDRQTISGGNCGATEDRSESKLTRFWAPLERQAQ